MPVNVRHSILGEELGEDSGKYLRHRVSHSSLQPFFA